MDIVGMYDDLDGEGEKRPSPKKNDEKPSGALTVTTRPALSEKEQKRLDLALICAAQGREKALIGTREISDEAALQAIKDLVAQGANVDYMEWRQQEWHDPYCVSPLERAVSSFERFKLLLELGADPNIALEKNGSVLWDLRDAEGGDLDAWLEKWLVHGGDLDLRNKNGETALINHCGRHDRHRVVEALVRHGADVNAQNNFGSTALMRATVNEKAVIVRFLIDSGADLFIQNEHGRTALNFAESNGNMELVNLLKDAMGGGTAALSQDITVHVGWSSNDVDLVTHTSFDETIGRGMQYMFNMASKGVLITMVGPDGQPISGITQACFEDFDEKSGCYDPSMLAHAKSLITPK
jgi:hypothetical protein